MRVSRILLGIVIAVALAVVAVPAPHRNGIVDFFAFAQYRPGRRDFRISPTMQARWPANFWLDPEKTKARIRSLRGRPRELLAAYGTSCAPWIKLDRVEFAPDRVLADVGCGTGALEVRLLVEQRPFARLYAVDVDRPSLEVLKTALRDAGLPGAGRVSLVQSVAYDARLPTRKVDAVVLVATGLNCLARPTDDEMTFLASLHHALRRPGGKVHFFEPLRGPFGCAPSIRVPQLRQAHFRIEYAARQHVPTLQCGEFVYYQLAPR